MKNRTVLVCLAASLLGFTSCESLLEVDPPTSKIPASLIFADDNAATFAVKGMYIELYGPNSFAAGNEKSVMMFAGLSADELTNIAGNEPQFNEFEDNEINPENDNVFALWRSMYESIYNANAVLEGLENSTGVTAAAKNQLRGEALFVRAFSHFYLVNLFGDVPIVVVTDYKTNARLMRSPKSDVYDRIKADLTEAENLLSENYPDAERYRVNQSAASALLSRVYLYTGDWGRAEEKASKVIDKTGLYDVISLSNVFFANSKEAIWQLRSPDPDPVVNESGIFNPVLAKNVLNPQVLSAFETNDLRKTTWIKSFVSGTETLYVPDKYKRTRTGQAIPKEYSMIIRLAEVYLIRAEARVRLGKLSLAIADIDKIRFRAGLPLIQNTNPSAEYETLLTIIDNERRVELFTEWGHRWLDLKRRSLADDVLGPIKPAWTSDDQLYPIPSKEIRNNSNLAPQNPGY